MLENVTKAYLTMVPTSMVEAGQVLQLVDGQGRLIGNQIEVKLTQSALSGDSLVTVTFQFDGQYVSWWDGGDG